MGTDDDRYQKGVEAALNAIVENFIGGGGASQHTHDLCDGVVAGRAAFLGLDFKWPDEQSAEFMRGWEFGRLVGSTRRQLLGA